MHFLTSVSPAVEALTTGLSSIASDMTAMVGDVIPIAGTVLGTILVVTLGVKLFRRFAK